MLDLYKKLGEAMQDMDEEGKFWWEHSVSSFLEDIDARIERQVAKIVKFKNIKDNDEQWNDDKMLFNCKLIKERIFNQFSPTNIHALKLKQIILEKIR